MSDSNTLYSIIQAGLVLGATMSWSNVLQNAVNYVWPNNNTARIEAQILYSLILTMIIIFLFYFIQLGKKEISNIQADVGHI